MLHSYSSIFALPRGGRVTVDITMPDGTELEGVSKCHPKDNFDAKLGVRRAIVRTHWWRHLGLVTPNDNGQMVPTY